MSVAASFHFKLSRFYNQWKGQEVAAGADRWRDKNQQKKKNMK